jgi:predicted dehydrogenase
MRAVITAAAQSVLPVYRVAMVGAGRYANTWARAYQTNPRCEIVAVADIDEENCRITAARFGVPGYSTYAEMFASEQIDIAAPILHVSANPDAVVASATAGVKAVYSEKPLASTLVDADRMVAACAAAGIPFGTGNVVSTNTDYQRAYALASSGEIGQVLRINLYEGNGQMGTHGLNLCRKFAGSAVVTYVDGGYVEGDPFAESEDSYVPAEQPSAVGADAAHLAAADPAVPGEDGAAGFFGKFGGHIVFENGVEAFSSWNAPSWRGLEVIGTEGMITATNTTSVGLRLFKRAPGAERFAEPVEVDVGFEPLDAARPTELDADGWLPTSPNMAQCVEEMVWALDTGEPFRGTSGDDMRHALEIAVALRESARRDGARVQLPLRGALRHVRMLPEFGRWNFKKYVHGVEWYREQMNNGKGPILAGKN